jgi:site-specific DNA recombinase
VLCDISYLGYAVNLRYITASYKNKRQIERPESKWLKFQNTHEQDIWIYYRDIGLMNTPVALLRNGNDI